MADLSVITDILEPPCNVMYGDYVGSLYLCIHKKVNRMRITFSKFFYRTQVSLGSGLWLPASLTPYGSFG